MVELWDVLDKNRNKTSQVMKRGWMKPGEFHLIVHVWIKNTEGLYLIAKRTGNKRWPNLWGCTIGSAVTQDNSLKTALKETKEELGIALDPKRGKKVKAYINFVTDAKDCGEFIDVWIFTKDVDISNIIFQENETCEAKWATKEEIYHMMENKCFIPLIDLPYFHELGKNE